MSLRDIYERGFDEDDTEAVAVETCPDCEGSLTTAGWETCCSECGLVVEERTIDYGPEWTAHEGQGREPSRVGPPVTLTRHDRGLSTEISHGGDARGDPLSATKRRQISRLRTHHQRARWSSKQEQNLSHACGEIARLVAALDLPRLVREEASLLFRRAQAANIVQGRSLEAVTSGCVYAACRLLGFVRTVEEIAEVARCPKSKVTLGYTLLNIELGLAIAPVGPCEYIPSFASDCGAAGDVERRALELAAAACEAGVNNGCNPAGIAAASLYVASREFGDRITQADLADAAEVSIPTLRRRFRELRELVED